MLNDHHDGTTMTDEANTISGAAVAPPSSRGQASFRAQAVLAGTGIDLAALGSTDRTGAAPLAVELIGSLTGGSLAAHSAAGGGVAVSCGRRHRARAADVGLHRAAEDRAAHPP